MHEISPDLFKQVPLRVNSFLAGIPARTLYRIELPGGYPGSTLREISAITGFGGEGEVTVRRRWDWTFPPGQDDRELLVRRYDNEF